MNSRIDPDGSRAAYIPLGYYVDLLELIADNRDVIEVLTYNDLAWGDDRNFAANYPAERKNWERLIASGERDPNKIYVLIQHDVDSRPERSMEHVRHEMRLGVPTNVMIFNRRVDRRHLRDTGELRLTDYEIDDTLLNEACGQGFVVGYHSNSFERALFDFEEAARIFVSDIADLRKRFPIRFFSAHGGTPSPEGLNNRDAPFPEAMQDELRWVHNGHTPWFDGNYSDGGLNSPKRDPAKRDLRDFVKTWKPGRRYRILTHPQYYFNPCSISPRLAGTPWYEEVRAMYELVPPVSAWKDIAFRVDEPKRERVTAVPTSVETTRMARRFRDWFLSKIHRGS